MSDADVITVDGALTLRRAESVDDWYVIERAEHDGRKWFESTEYGARLMISARISDACVEGDSREMRALADAIEKRGEYRAKRCAVEVHTDVDGREFHTYLWSPRNSLRRARVSLPIADALVRTIRKTLGNESRHDDE